MVSGFSATWPHTLLKTLKEKLGFSVTFGPEWTNKSYLSGGDSREMLTDLDYNHISNVVKPALIIAGLGGFSDANNNSGISIAESKTNQKAVVDKLRSTNPNAEIVVYTVNQVRADLMPKHANLSGYMQVSREVADEKGTFLADIYTPSAALYNQVTSSGGDWDEYVIDDHHPSVAMGVELIIPYLLTALSGSDYTDSLYYPMYAEISKKQELGIGNNENIQVYCRDCNKTSLQVGLLPEGWYEPINIPWNSVNQQDWGFKWTPGKTIGGRTIPNSNDCVLFLKAPNGDTFKSDSFTVVGASDVEKPPPPPITIEAIDPVNFVGDNLVINWQYDVSEMNGVTLAVSLDNARSWHMLVPSSTTATTYTWAIPATLEGESTITNQAKIKVEDYDQVYAMTSNNFSIVDFSNPDNIHLKINAGASDVSGWEDGSLYVSSGSPEAYDFGSMSSGGGDCLAPIDVYKTVLHSYEGNHAYTFPLPDATYTVRLHFSDKGDGRTMTFKIEGVTVISGYEPPDNAHVKEFKVIVSDGNGLTIAAESGGSEKDVFVAGIEILGGEKPCDSGSPVVPFAESALLEPSFQVRLSGNEQYDIRVNVQGPYKLDIINTRGVTVRSITGCGRSVFMQDSRLAPGIYTVILRCRDITDVISVLICD